MMMPQLTEQYGQVLRVCVVREILRVEDCACSGCRSKPSAESPTAPATPVFRKVRRDRSIQISRSANRLDCCWTQKLAVALPAMWTKTTPWTGTVSTKTD